MTTVATKLNLGQSRSCYQIGWVTAKITLNLLCFVNRTNGNACERQHVGSYFTVPVVVLGAVFLRPHRVISKRQNPLSYSAQRQTYSRQKKVKPWDKEHTNSLQKCIALLFNELILKASTAKQVMKFKVPVS